MGKDATKYQLLTGGLCELCGGDGLLILNQFSERGHWVDLDHIAVRHIDSAQVDLGPPHVETTSNLVDTPVEGRSDRDPYSVLNATSPLQAENMIFRRGVIPVDASRVEFGRGHLLPGGTEITMSCCEAGSSSMFSLGREIEDAEAVFTTVFVLVVYRHRGDGGVTSYFLDTCTLILSTVRAKIFGVSSMDFWRIACPDYSSVSSSKRVALNFGVLWLRSIKVQSSSAQT
jgi:hypothetical protein